MRYLSFLSSCEPRLERAHGELKLQHVCYRPATDSLDIPIGWVPLIKELTAALDPLGCKVVTVKAWHGELVIRTDRACDEAIKLIGRCAEKAARTCVLCGITAKSELDVDPCRAGDLICGPMGPGCRRKFTDVTFYNPPLEYNIREMTR